MADGQEKKKNIANTIKSTVTKFEKLRTGIEIIIIKNKKYIPST